MRVAVPLEDLTEKVWQQQIVQLARTVGWRSYHTLRSKGSQPGYPDLTLVRDRVVFVEVKTEKGKLSEKQREWLTALWVAGAEVYVARPRDLERLGDVLTAQVRRDRDADWLDEFLREDLRIQDKLEARAAA